MMRENVNQNFLGSEPIEPAIMAHGKILDDYGNVIGTF